MLKYEGSLSLEDLPVRVYQDLVAELNKNNCWETFADYIIETFDFARSWRKSLDNLPPRNVTQGEIILKELSEKMCTVDIFSTLLEQCNLVNILSILRSPELAVITTNPSDTQVYFGGEVHLKCTALGIPPPSYQWYHENNKLDNQKSNELNLEITSPSQEGSYICKVSQVDQNGEVIHEVFSEPASVTIMPSPVVIIQEPITSVEVVEGGSFVLSCDAVGYPAPEYQWFKGNTSLDGEINKILKVDRFTVKKEGSYHCYIKNKISENFTRKCTAKLELPRQKAVAKVALLIANENYRSQTSLKTPIKDVTDVANILNGLGFTTICLADLTLTQMNSAIKIFADSLVEGTYGLFYFAGHGFKMQENYMLPIDAPESYLRKDAVCESELLSMTLKNDPALMVVILDMCQTAPRIEWNPQIHEEIPSINEYKGQKDLRNLLQAYSTSSYRPSYEHNQRECGLYAEHLCKFLGDNIPVTKVFEEVGKSVDKCLEGAERKQIPMFATTLTKPFRLTDAFSTDSPPPPITLLEESMRFPKMVTEVRFETTGVRCKAVTSQYMKPFLNFIKISLIELDDKWEVLFCNYYRLEHNNLQICSDMKNNCFIHNPQVTKGPIVFSLLENRKVAGAYTLQIKPFIPTMLHELI